MRSPKGEAPLTRIVPQPGIMDIALYEGGASHLEGKANVLVPPIAAQAVNGRLVDRVARRVTWRCRSAERASERQGLDVACQPSGFALGQVSR